MTNFEIFHRDAEKYFKQYGINAIFKRIKDTTIKKPDLIVSVCVFRMPDPYKDESTYIKGLNILLDNFDKAAPNTILRIYYDDSVILKDDKWEFLIKKAKDSIFVQLVHYKFPQFKTPNTFYHEGVFGMIVRYIVLFDFGDIVENVMIDDIDYISISDLEIMYKLYREGLKKTQKTKTNFLFSSYKTRAYLTKARLMVTDITKKYDFTLRMVTQPSLCKKKLNKKIILEFMKCVLEKCPEYEKWMEEVYINTNCENPRNNPKLIHQCEYLTEMKKEPHGIFMFGTDEYFLNGPILENFLKNKEEFLVLYEIPSMTHYHYYIFLMFKERRISVSFLVELYNAMLGTTNRGVKGIYEDFNELDKKLYNVKEQTRVLKNKETKDILKKMYKYLKQHVNFLKRIPDLLPHEIQMFDYLDKLKEVEFTYGKQFYKVIFLGHNDYKLERI